MSVVHRESGSSNLLNMGARMSVHVEGGLGLCCRQTTYCPFVTSTFRRRLTLVYAVMSRHSLLGEVMHAHIAPSAIDPIPLDHVTLPEVVTLLTAQMSNRDIATAPPPTVLQTLMGPLDWSLAMGSGPNAESFAAWCKREEAVRVIRLAVLNGGLTAKIAAASGFVRLETADWQYVAFYDQIIRSGVIRSSVGERIGRHEGSRLLIDKAEALSCSAKGSSGNRPPLGKCADWLEAEMRDLSGTSLIRNRHIAARPLKISAFLPATLTRFGNRLSQKPEQTGIDKVAL